MAPSSEVIFLSPPSKRVGWICGFTGLFLDIKYWPLRIHSVTAWKRQVCLGTDLSIYMLLIDLIWKGILQTGNMKSPRVTRINHHMAFTSTFLFHDGACLPIVLLALTKVKDSFHVADGLTMYLSKMFSDIISAIHRCTYTDAQIPYWGRFLPKHWPSKSQ